MHQFLRNMGIKRKTYRNFVEHRFFKTNFGHQNRACAFKKSHSHADEKEILVERNNNLMRSEEILFCLQFSLMQLLLLLGSVTRLFFFLAQNPLSVIFLCCFDRMKFYIKKITLTLFYREATIEKQAKSNGKTIINVFFCK